MRRVLKARNRHASKGRVPRPAARPSLAPRSADWPLSLLVGRRLLPVATKDIQLFDLSCCGPMNSIIHHQAMPFHIRQINMDLSDKFSQFIAESQCGSPRFSTLG
jgi:hypothetical protein